jgi:Fic family protein
VRAGYPPIAIRPEDRPAYIAALEIAERGGGHAAFDELLFSKLESTLDMYIAAARQAQSFAEARGGRTER